jgi:hypothetical protein
MSVPLFISETSKPDIFARSLPVGCLIFERMDQMDFTGPFEALSCAGGSEKAPFRKEMVCATALWR